MIREFIYFVDDNPNGTSGMTAQEVVRCQDCKHWVYNFNGCSRNPCTEPWYALDFCSYGERNSSEKPNNLERSSE